MNARMIRRRIFLLFSALIFMVGYLGFRYIIRPKELNIIILNLDALRPDHLGCYGYKRNTSPNIDRLSREAVVFTQAIVQAPWTGASLNSLFTSQYPSSHKVDDFGVVLDDRITPIAEMLKVKGYYNIATNDAGLFDKATPGLLRGFSAYITAGDASEIARQAAGWLRELKDKKFFMFIHFSDYPHAPYSPPAPYNKMFAPSQGNRSIPLGKGLGMKGFIPDFVSVNGITNPDYYIAQYDGEIAYADEQVGKILEALKELDLVRKTIIIVSSDHGECLGEHDYYFQHAFYLYEQLLKVPLIIKLPSVSGGRVVNQQVQMIDIMPTVLSLLNIKTNVKMEGQSLLPVIFGRNNKRLYAFSEVFNEGGDNLKSIRTDEWKLVFNLTKKSYELYNLKADPQEKSNLAGGEGEQFKLLKAELEDWMGRPKQDIRPLKIPFGEEDKDRLRVLGYVQ